MTTTTEKRTVRFTLASGDMLNLLANAAPFATKDDTLPVLTHLKLEVRDGNLEAVATDRYRIAWVTKPLMSFEGDVDATQLLLPRSLAESFAKALKSLKGNLHEASDWNVEARGDAPASHTATLTAEIEGRPEAREVANVTWRLDFAGGSLSGAANYSNEFPRVRSLAVAADPDDSHGIFALSPTLLADFLKVKNLIPRRENNLPIRFGAGKAGKPIGLQYSDWFEGVIMPVRLPEHVAHSKRAA